MDDARGRHARDPCRRRVVPGRGPAAGAAKPADGTGAPSVQLAPQDSRGATAPPAAPGRFAGGAGAEGVVPIV